MVMAERASEDESEAHEQRSSDDVDGWSFALSLLRDIAIVRWLAQRFLSSPFVLLLARLLARQIAPALAHAHGFQAR